MDHPRPGLRYISVSELDGDRRTFDGFTVDDPAGEKLGKLEGFILDVNSARPYYVVCDAGGWFRSKHFLLPIGHVALDSESRKLIADVTKDHVRRYPGFDLDEFKKLSEDDLYRIAQGMAAECCPNEAIDRSQPAYTRFEIWSHYRTPTWWDSSYYQPSGVKETLAGSRRE
ncbi:MAG TPA: PRC-barrel domain-containing protein [Vicinamibacterales bacterium]|nr:PRC-barrel domain-containing protein [Vicinamibacterales bacterium]